MADTTASIAGSAWVFVATLMATAHQHEAIMIGLESLDAWRSFNVMFGELIDELFDCGRQF